MELPFIAQLEVFTSSDITHVAKKKKKNLWPTPFINKGVMKYFLINKDQSFGFQVAWFMQPVFRFLSGNPSQNCLTWVDYCLFCLIA